MAGRIASASVFLTMLALAGCADYTWYEMALAEERQISVTAIMELEKARRETDKARDAVTEKEYELGAVRNKLALQQLQVHKYQVDLRMARDETAKARGKMRSAERVAEAMQAELKKANQRADLAYREISRLETELKAARDKVAELTKDIQRLEKRGR